MKYFNCHEWGTSISKQRTFLFAFSDRLVNRLPAYTVEDLEAWEIGQLLGGN